MPSSQLCFVYLSNYPSLIPLKDWLVGICLVFLPQSLWSDAHKHLLTARQKRWSPDPRPEGPESNEWRLHLFVFLIGKPISRSAACHCKLRARAGGNSTFFSQALVPRTPVSTEAGACLNFTSLERSCCLGQVLPLIAEPPPPPPVLPPGLCIAQVWVYHSNSVWCTWNSLGCTNPFAFQAFLYSHTPFSSYEVLHRRPVNKRDTSRTALIEAEMWVSSSIHPVSLLPSAVICWDAAWDPQNSSESFQNL